MNIFPRITLKQMTVLDEMETKKIANSYADVTPLKRTHTEIISMCIVPVQIRHWKNIKKEVLTYAMLDSYSQGSFIQEDW